MDEIVWVYVGKGEFIDGVPARSLTQGDVDWLHPDLRSAVEQSRLYRRPARPKVEEAKQPEKQPDKEKGFGAERAEDAKGKKE